MSITFGLSKDWVMWDVGLDDASVARVAGGRYAADNGTEENVRGAIRMIDDRARSTPETISAALWLPAKDGREPRGSLLFTYYTVKRRKDADARRFLKNARNPPHTPGVVLREYSVDPTELAVGPAVVQYLKTYESDVEPEASTYRVTIFPPGHNEVYVLDFETVFTLLLDDFDDAIVEILRGVTVNRP